MTNKSLYVIIIAVVVVIAAAGAFLLLNNNSGHDEKKDLVGTYEFNSGDCVLLQNGSYEFDSSLIGKKFIIESFDGYNVIATWGDVSKNVKGIFVDGYIYFESDWTDKTTGNAFKCSGTAYCSKDVLYVSCNSYTMKKDVAMCTTGIFVKKDSKQVPAAITPLMEKGDVFNSYCNYKAYNGAFVTLTGEYSFEVKERRAGVYVLEYGSSTGGTMILIGATTNEHLVNCFNKLGISKLYVNGSVAQFDFNYVDGDGIVNAVTSCMKKDGQSKSFDYPNLSGKVYNGTAKGIDSTGTASSYEVHIAFGEYKYSFIDVVANVGEYVCATTAQLAWFDDEKGYTFHFNIYLDHEGVKLSTYVFGFVSKDSKSISIFYRMINDDGLQGVANASLKLNEESGKGMVGCYVIGEWRAVKDGDYYDGDAHANKYEQYLAIYSAKDHVFSAMYNHHEIVGSYNGDKGYFSFSCEKWDILVTMDIGTNGIVLRGSGIIDTSSYASMVQYTLASKQDSEPLPEYESIFDVGEKFTAFGALKRVGDTDTELTKEEANTSIECVVSKNGVYSFKATVGGKDLYIAAYGTAKYGFLTAASYDGNTMITFTVNKHTDNYVCLDREYKENGKKATIVYRMSADGNPVKPTEITVIDGKKYEGNMYLISLVDGVSVVQKESYNATFTKQNSSIVCKTDYEGTVIGHLMISGTDPTPKVLKYFDTFDVRGKNYNFEIVGIFSDDLKTLQIYAVSTTSMNVAYYAELHLVN